MRPAFSKAPLDYLFALAVCALIVGTSFAVKPAVTEWAVFGVGAAMGAVVLALAVRPVRS
jgi:hypothetical protein